MSKNQMWGKDIIILLSIVSLAFSVSCDSNQKWSPPSGDEELSVEVLGAEFFESARYWNEEDFVSILGTPAERTVDGERYYQKMGMDALHFRNCSVGIYSDRYLLWIKFRDDSLQHIQLSTPDLPLTSMILDHFGVGSAAPTQVVYYSYPSTKISGMVWKGHLGYDYFVIYIDEEKKRIFRIEATLAGDFMWSTEGPTGSCELLKMMLNGSGLRGASMNCDPNGEAGCESMEELF